MASVVAGVIGCLIYTGAQLIAPYALFDHLVHYPFLHEDFTNSGIRTIKDYLMSEKGYWGVVGTTVGMLRYALPFCLLLGECPWVESVAYLDPGQSSTQRVDNNVLPSMRLLFDQHWKMAVSDPYTDVSQI